MPFTLRYLNDLRATGQTNRRWWAVGLGGAALLATVLFGSGAFEGDVIADKVDELDYTPLARASNTVTPGSIYAVDFFGNVKLPAVCEVGTVAARLDQPVAQPRPGKGEKFYLKSNRSSAASLKARTVEYLKTVGLSGKGNYTSTLIFEVENYLGYADDIALNGIVGLLQGHDDCRRALNRRIRNGECLVQAESVLVASAHLQVSQDAAIGSEPEPDERGVVNTPFLVEDLGFGEEAERVGKSLIYGLALRDNCMDFQSDGGRVVRWVPSYNWWAMTHMRNYWVRLLDSGADSALAAAPVPPVN